ncbi:carbohydrate-binding domain-containing protein [Roseburia sp. MUC/MUC-530-WT-4D]|uniref:Carbohydrate-binding domain-containing protein n=1 Tax=Roseburia porci TaxID=2605790 RepID=A0A6L5YMQ6_9FIRM|nr:carbohydrate-binding domain-containing protein [Roseburia porci]MCI5516472.1 carbohydrate-binding domain-containing protein [Roseburia sp.]MDD6743592.1 carbohydrate-binding domain-containing protein [Roseburia porci]MST73568.1 carbohydrate-binding domain-containing protein [Roseburia porci]
MSKKKKQAVIVVTISILVAAVIILMMQIGQNTSKTAEKSAVISLADDGIKIKGGGVTVKDQVITITNPGDYTFSGSLSDGRIVIDVSEGTVNVTLNGVDITSSERDVIFSKDSAEVNVIVADGTDNTLVSGTEDFTADEDDLDEDGTYKNKQKAVIFTKGNLTISGTGSLNVTGNIYNGIQTKGTLSLQDVQLTVNAVHHGVKSKQEMSLISGTYDVTSGEDGFHSDLNITVSDGSYAIAAGDDGIHADGELTVDNGSITISESVEGLEGHMITINDGQIDITSSDDGINANGGSQNGFGMGGGMQQPQNADGSAEPPQKPDDSDTAGSSENMPQMPDNSDGSMGDMPQMPEGTEMGEAPSDMPQEQEENKDSDSEESDSQVDTTTTPELTINGGSIHVNAQGDGIDSNGNITINGGTVYVDGPSGGGDSALDYGTENGGILTINGGNVIAIGMSDMLEAVDASSTQTSIMYVFSQTVTKGTEVTVSDSNGNTVFTYTPVKDADSVILSSADLTEGETYTFTYGEQSESITVDSVNTTNYTRSAMGPGKR